MIAMLVALLWGSQVTAVKIGGLELPPILMVAMRFAMIALVLVPFCRFPKRDEWYQVIWIASLTGALHFGLLYCGISQVDASTSAIVYQLATPFTVMLAFIALGERITPKIIIGIAFAFFGVLLALGGVGDGGSFMGVVLVILAAFAFAIGTIVTKRCGPFDPIAMNYWIALIAAPELMLISAGVELDQWSAVFTASTSAWLAVCYTAFSGGLIGFGLWYWLIGRYPVQQLAPFTLLVPVFAVVVSQVMLKETLSFNLILGGVVSLCGVALCQRQPAKNTEAHKPLMNQSSS
jgi:O-acetylserine/cysteine efflux transporter